MGSDGKHNEEKKDEMVQEDLADEFNPDIGAYEDAFLELLSINGSNDDDYLVDGAVLSCNRATANLVLVKGQPVILTQGIGEEERTHTILSATKSNAFIKKRRVITVKDRELITDDEKDEGKNLRAFRCNCINEPNNEEAKDILCNLDYYRENGTCCRLIKLNDDWENMIRDEKYHLFDTEAGDRTELAEGVTKMSMLFCSNGGLITPVTSGQEQVTEGGGAPAGYLAYGGGMAKKAEYGFYMLYDGPTLAGEGRTYMFADIYREYGNGIGALQAYCAKGLNTMNGEIRYEGQDEYTKQNGVLTYKGINRYAIALGPALQNPELGLDSGKEIAAKDMIYGTCVDVTIMIGDKTYYIPAVIVDTKAHTAPHGMFQTGKHFGSEDVVCDIGNIVEWYVEQGKGDKNKSLGLIDYDSNGGIIIYDGENNATKVD